jgi:hypothetical protein
MTRPRSPGETLFLRNIRGEEANYLGHEPKDFAVIIEGLRDGTSNGAVIAAELDSAKSVSTGTVLSSDTTP